MKDELSLLNNLPSLLLANGNIESLANMIGFDKIKKEKIKNETHNYLLHNYKFSLPLVIPKDEDAIVVFFKIKYNRYSFGNIISLKNDELKKHFIKLSELAIEYLSEKNPNLIPYVDWRNFSIEMPGQEYILNNIEGNSYDLAFFIGILNAIVNNKIKNNYLFSGVYDKSSKKFVSPDNVKIKEQACKREFKDSIEIIIPNKNGWDIDDIVSTVFKNNKINPQLDYSINESYYRIMEYKNDNSLSDMNRLYQYLIKNQKSVKMKNLLLKVMYRIAENHNHNGKLSESLEWYNKLHEKYDAMKKKGELYTDSEILNIMNSYGVLLTDLYQYKKAEKVLLANLKDKEERKFTDDQKAKTLGSLGQLYTFWNKFEEGENYLKRTVKIMSKMDPEESIRDKVYLSYNYILRQEFKKADNIIKKAKKEMQSYIRKREDYERQLIYIYNNLILLNYKSKRFKNAIEQYNKVNFRNHHGPEKAHIIQYAGYSYFKIGNINKSRGILNKAIKEYKFFNSFDTDLQIIAIYLFFFENYPKYKAYCLNEIEQLLDKNKDHSIQVNNKKPLKIKEIYEDFEKSNGNLKKIKKLFSFIRA